MRSIVLLSSSSFLGANFCWEQSWATRPALFLFSCDVLWQIWGPVDYSRCQLKKCSQESWQRRHGRRETPGTERDVRRRDQSEPAADRRLQKARADHQSAG